MKLRNCNLPQAMFSLRRTLLLLLVVVFLSVSSSSNLYKDDDSGYIFEIESADDVIDSDQIWMVQLYNPQVTEAAQVAAGYKHLSNIMRGLFALGVIDVTDPSKHSIIEELRMKKPSKAVAASFYVVSDDKENPIKVKSKNGQPVPEVQNLAEALMEQAAHTISDRSRSPAKPAGSRKSGTSSAKQKKPPKPDKSYVVQLNSTNFAQFVYHSLDVVAVAFTAPWCGHCTKLKPEWEEAAAKLAGSGAVLGWVDATVEKDLAKQYGVKGYPTIKVFPGNGPTIQTRTPSDATDYPAERTARAIVNYMLQVVDKTGYTPPPPELTGINVLEENCSGHNRICVIAALPHILDSGASGRNKYIEILAQVAKTFRGSAFTFLWYEYSTQPALEQVLDLAFGAPALFIISLDRLAYSIYRGSFKEMGIGQFLKAITNGKQTIIPLPNAVVPKIESVTPWDGKDGQLLEEEMSLEDIMGDEL